MTQKIMLFIFIGIFVPASLSVAGWWFGSFLLIMGLIKSQARVVSISMGLFVAGMIVNLFYLRKLVSIFYCYNIKLLIILNIFWSFVLLGAFGGMPFGNIVLGVLTGLYMGKRNKLKNEQYNAHKIALFTAALTGSLAALAAIFQITSNRTAGLAAASALFLVASIIALLQYFLSKLSYNFTYKQ